MKISSEDIGLYIGHATQILLTLALCIAIGACLWDMLSLPYGIIGFALFYLLILLFVSPIVAYGFPVVSLVVGMIAWAIIALFRKLRPSL